jgi:hypothetical protein
MRKPVLLLFPLVFLTLAATPHAGATDTTVRLVVDLAGADEVADCDVDVPSGASGIDVLDQAVDDECIESYHPEDFGFGEYVACINEICEQPSAYPVDQPSPFPVVSWLIYLEGGGFAEVGVSELSFPTDGDTLRFSYEAWPVHLPCFVLDVGCPGE